VENANADHCDYCGRKWKRTRAIELEDLLSFMRDRIEVEYEDAANSVGFDSGEGGYQLPTMDGYQLLDEFGIGWDLDNSKLRDDLAAEFSDTPWVHKYPYSLTEEQARRIGWQDFADLVKHRVRFLLFPTKNDGLDPEVTAPADMLAELGRLFTEYDLFWTVEAGTSLYRVRIHSPDNKPANTLAALGPPPSDAARFSNRMSPAGVSMFYAAFDEATAIAETNVRHDGKPAERTVAMFKVTRDLLVLDLVHLPQVPSIFDSDEANLNRAALGFLHEFVFDLTQPIEKDGREHIEYVPSQVVTEYVRYRLGERVGKQILGIRYPSARLDGGVGCVLFVSGEDLEESRFGENQPFILASDATKTASIDTTPLE
jgi:hypothetical protein